MLGIRFHACCGDINVYIRGFGYMQQKICLYEASYGESAGSGEVGNRLGVSSELRESIVFQNLSLEVDFLVRMTLPGLLGFGSTTGASSRSRRTLSSFKATAASASSIRCCSLSCSSSRARSQASSSRVAAVSASVSWVSLFPSTSGEVCSTVIG